MHPHSRRLGGLLALALVALVVGGCASSKPASGSSATPEASTARPYLAAVNALCDALLPQVVAATHGGSIDIPARQYLRDLPAHRQLLTSFDQSLAAVPVPAAATRAAAAMHDYITYANRLDASRLIAAERGERAWRHEVAAEKSAAADPSIAARTAAGFNDSCDAR